MLSTQDQGHLSKHLLADGEKQTTPKYRKRARTVTAATQLTWNQFTQRLRCPWCRKVFVAGLLLYPVTSPVNIEPADVQPTRSERQELRRLAEGYCVEEPYASSQEVNLVVPAPCSCPVKGWSSACPIHGTPRSGA